MTIVADACYAGCWAEKLRKDVELNPFSVAIVCAANSGRPWYLLWLAWLGYGNPAIARGATFIPNWLVGQPIPGPQVPIAYRTLSYNSALFGQQVQTLQQL